VDHGAADVPARGEARRQAGEDEAVALPEELRLGDTEAFQMEPQLEAVAHAVGDGGGGQGLGRQVRGRAADKPRHEQERDEEQGARDEPAGIFHEEVHGGMPPLYPVSAAGR